MSAVQEALENAEHTHHAAHASQGKWIGLTMALIGVLIAFCAAMVGSERNELTRTMIEQTQAHSDYTSASTKFRLIMIELEKERQFVGRASASSAPSPVLVRFIKLYLDYSKERSYSKNWADSYAPLIDAHFGAAEGYERAQLLAEIGIVIASLAVLLSSRAAWYVSIALAVICIGQLVLTCVHTDKKVGLALAQVQKADEIYQQLRKAHTSSNDDEKTVDELDAGGKIRGQLEASDSKN